ncbi:hypothetical protein F441_19781 [Phytophthora nicotianae CJ01A1]|uniref:Uncharacterized protein n=1 Tax=Phytophthora nicotianae CJ01A1 TaxID=1317063 RepID=W2W0W2_PHYNI|nr:hypothetical protein F441_19781 [Phytophthora nicotianae CJ01A1]
MVKKRGTFIMVGIPNDDGKISPMLVVAKGITWVGSLVGSLQDTTDIVTGQLSRTAWGRVVAPQCCAAASATTRA